MPSAFVHFLLAAISAGAATVATAQTRPAVVELFTSEGCSSCPPAEAYVGELAQRSDVLALTFHVDYWDDLGWRDRFALPDAVQRQRTYGKNLRLSSVYTPQIVIDGRDDFVGSDRHSIDQALSRRRSGVPVALAVQDGEVLVALGSLPNVAISDVVLVAYQHAAVSPIGRGENAGRTIRESNIVREIRLLGRWHGQDLRYHSPIDSFPQGSTDIAVLVQPAGQAPIIGAAAIALR